MSQTTSVTDSQYASATGSLTSGATGSSEMGKDEFLLLLVTQFQYQDPLNPMEDKEFIAQLAQFSALEQSMNMNENMQLMLTAQQESNTMGAVSYMGKEVLARGYQVSVEDGNVTTFQYALEEEAATGYVNILDANNQFVTSIDLPAKGAGIHDFPWDGKDADGNTVPDGVYTIGLVCKDAEGQAIIADTQVGGLVTGVNYYGNDQYLKFSDGRLVALAEVREIIEPDKVSVDDESADSGSSSSGSTDSDSIAGTGDTTTGG